MAGFEPTTLHNNGPLYMPNISSTLAHSTTVTRDRQFYLVRYGSEKTLHTVRFGTLKLINTYRKPYRTVLFKPYLLKSSFLTVLLSAL